MDNWDQGPLPGPSTFSRGPIPSLLPAEPLSGSWGGAGAVAAHRSPQNPPGAPILPQPRATTPGHIVTPRTPGSGVCQSQLLQDTLLGTATSGRPGRTRLSWPQGPWLRCLSSPWWGCPSPTSCPQLTVKGIRAWVSPPQMEACLCQHVTKAFLVHGLNKELAKNLRSQLGCGQRTRTRS